ncbi:putative metabolite transport protein [Actinomadura cremea]|nr:putative metabolite transport protein [Actinomadura cremea]
MTQTTPGRAPAWYRGATKDQWRTFTGAYLGWMLDVMDLMLFAMVISDVSADLDFDQSAAGFVASAALVATAVGGLLFGFIADRFGRTRSMVFSIVGYSAGTLLCGFSTSLTMLLVFRVVVGVCLGGEWSAGTALVSETWPERHRGKVLAWVQSAFGVGYALAALVAAIVLPIGGWRWVFFVGVLPALSALWIRRHTPEPKMWLERRERVTLGGAVRTLLTEHRRPFLVAMTFTSFAMLGYWGLFTWIPTYLSTPVDEGGMGMDLVHSTTWIVLMQVGAVIGFISFGYVADRIGRKAAFITYFALAAVLVPVFVSVSQPAVLLVVGIVVSLFGTGFYSGFGPAFAELFPTHIRGTAQGVVYNGSRAISAAGPATIGVVADRFGASAGLGITTAFFVLAALTVAALLPETRGKALA